MPQQPSKKEYEQEPMVIECEGCRTLKELANGIALGVNKIPILLLKVVGEEEFTILTAICAQIWSNILWPKMWKKSVSKPLPKKGDAENVQITKPLP